jgi:hypothetical protein
VFGGQQDDEIFIKDGGFGLERKFENNMGRAA